jgi:hypothetical protein
MRVVPKKWGHEHWIENNSLYCLKMISCQNEIWSSSGKFHYHRVKDETFYVIEGILELDHVKDDGTIVSGFLREGDSVRIFPGIKHRFRSATPRCRFIEASTQHFEEDSIRTELIVKDKVQTWVDDE